MQSSKREQMNKIRQAAADMVVSYQREVKLTAPSNIVIFFFT